MSRDSNELISAYLDGEFARAGEQIIYEIERETKSNDCSPDLLLFWLTVMGLFNPKSEMLETIC